MTPHLPRTSRRRRTGLLLATLAITAPLYAACAEGDSAADPGGSTPSASPSTTPPEPSDGPSDGPSDDPSQEPTDGPTDGADGAAGGDTGTSQETALVYLVGPTPQGPRLFSEYQPITPEEAAASRGGVDAALARSAAGESLDPDYFSLLPAGAPTATTGDGLIQVTLPDASWVARPATMTPREAKVAVQQLVYTAQAALQERIPVAFLLDGSVSPVLGINAPEGVRAAKQLNVLSLVDLDSPEEGATVSGTFSASGVASSFEATVPWQLRDPDGAVVKEGFATAEGWLDRLYPFSVQVDIQDVTPGEYTFVARTDDPSGGEGGGPTEDTKTVTVQ